MNNREIYLQQCRSTLGVLGWEMGHPRVVSWFERLGLTWETATEAHLKKLGENLQAVLQQQRGKQPSSHVAGEDFADAIAACQVEARRLGWNLQNPIIRDWCLSRGVKSTEYLNLSDCRELEKWLRQQQADQLVASRLANLEYRVEAVVNVLECLADALLNGLSDRHREVIRDFAQENVLRKSHD